MKKLFFLLTAMIASVCAFAQDVIVTKDSKKIEAKITEVSKSEIRYKELDNLDGPTFILDVKNIVVVIYSNNKVVLYNQDVNSEVANAESTRKQKEAEAIKKANQMGNLFENTGDGQKGNLFGQDLSGGSSWTLMGRDIRGTLPKPSNNFRQEGKVVVQIRVNAAGDVVEAKCVEGTSVTDRYTQQLALDAAKKAKFTKGDSDQIGTITYIFKLN